MKILNSLFLISLILPGLAKGNDHALQVEQITQGPEHHFYGYIGHVQNIPWNGNERYIVALRSTFHDHLPGKGESADVRKRHTPRESAPRYDRECAFR